MHRKTKYFLFKQSEILLKNQIYVLALDMLGNGHCPTSIVDMCMISLYDYFQV